MARTSYPVNPTALAIARRGKGMPSSTGDLYGGDMARLMYGQHARHVPAWAYVQRHGEHVVGLVGGSRVAEGTPHPLLYGASYQHVFIVGEVIVRPRIAIGTDALMGYGAGSLYLGQHDFAKMLSAGRLLAGSEASLRHARQQWEES